MKSLPLHWKILIGFVVGVVAGLICRAYAVGTPGEDVWLTNLIAYVTGPLGKVFINLLQMLVIPMLLSALILGVAEMGDIRALGRVGWKTLAYTVVVSSIAVIIGLIAVNLFQPGIGVDEAARAELMADAGARAATITAAPGGAGAMDMLVGIVPKNIVAAASNGDMLGLMFFGLMFGIGLVLAATPATERVKEFAQGVFDISMRLIMLVLQLAPYAVAALLFGLVVVFGWDILVKLLGYAAVVIGALAVHMLVIYSLAVWSVGGMSPVFFFRGIQEAMVTAFSTASSAATLPTAIKVAEQNLKLPPRIARFVLTVGATANQNGTALFEGVTVLFLAQFFGIELSLGQQFVVMLVCILGGVGTAGVPAGSLPVIAMILGMVGIPVEGIGIIMGVDRLLDMCRTTLNVTGDLAAAVVVARGEVSEPVAAVAESADPSPPAA